MFVISILVLCLRTRLTYPVTRVDWNLIDYHVQTRMQENNCLKLSQMSNSHWCWKNEQHLNIALNFGHQIFLGKSKCWYSNNSLHFLKHTVPLSIFIYLYLTVVIFTTPGLIRHLWQLKTVVFLHWCQICVVPGNTKGEVSLYHWPPVWLVWISLFCK